MSKDSTHSRLNLPRCLSLSLCLALLCRVGAAQDTDGDGLSDALEMDLHTNPRIAEALETVSEGTVYAPTEAKPARYNLTRVRFGNVARGRWLWALEFGEPYRFENASLLLYVDADNNLDTGRPGMGCEVVYGQREGRPSQMLYVDAEKRSDFPMPRVGLENGVLYICADLALNQVEKRSVFRMWVLSEQCKPHRSIDTLRAGAVTGAPDSDRERVKTLADLVATEAMEVTQDSDLLWRLHADADNTVLNSYRDCEFKGFEYNHSEYRWPSVRKRSGRGVLRATVPRSGGLYVGVVVYDGQGSEKYELSVNGNVLGRFIADADNRRQRLFFHPKPVDLQAGDSITLIAAANDASYVVEDLMLLADRPPVLASPCRIRDLAVGYDAERQAMRVTWMTTWPTVCTVECGQAQLREDTPVQNHRVFLSSLRTGSRQACRVVTTDPKGNTVRSNKIRFKAGPPSAPDGAVKRGQMQLSILADAGTVPAGYPVTGGIPFPRGVLGDTEHLRLVLHDGSEQPMQARPLLHWPDASVKVALIDTVMPASGSQTLILEYGREIRRAAVTDGLRVKEQAGEVIIRNSVGLQAVFSSAASGLFTQLTLDGKPLTATADPARITITDEAGLSYDTMGPPDRLVLEERGPLRTVMRADGHHAGPKGEFFTYQIRMTFFSHLPGVKIAYRWGNDVSTAEFAEFRQVRFELPLGYPPDAPVLLGTPEPVRSTLVQGVRLEQLHDDSFTVGSTSGERAPGWVSARHGSLGAGVVTRNFWQLYPKAVGAMDDRLYLDICPTLADNQYEGCSELDLIKLYYYLQGGCYRVRQGVTKTHEFWVLGLGDTDSADPADLARATDLVNAPPLLAADPVVYADSGVFGAFVTAGKTPRYDDVCDRAYTRYVTTRDRGHHFGMLNFGDQWGERRVNWANGEYDHHHTMAQMFVRTTEPRWFYLMQAAAQHDMDVDFCHYHTNPRYRGAAWTHSMGHTGGYFRKRYQGKWGSPWPGTTPSHSWCEGTCEYYALTGDPSALEAARMLADHYGGAYLNNYDFTNGRIPGWHLLFTVAVYRTTGDPFYLNAARLIVDRVVERRTPGSGWARQMVPGHCHCEPRCRGTCSFMQGVLGCGLREYYSETADPRVPEAVVDSARYVIDQLWVPDREAFRYTSCPKSSVTTSRSDTLAGLLLFAYELSGDPRFADIVVRSMNLGFDHLGSMAHMRWTPYIMTALERLHREKIGLGGGTAVHVRMDNPNGRPVEVRLFDRLGRGAPPDAAVLSGPDLEPVRPGPDGRLRLQEAVAGVYELRTSEGTGPWQLTSSLNRLGIAFAKGVELNVAGKGRLYLQAASGTEQVRLTLTILDGRVKASLVDDTGTVLAPARRIRRNGTILTLDASRKPSALLVLEGHGQVRLEGTGVMPWASWSEGRFFNASAPAVTVRGDPVVLPGTNGAVDLHALVSDPENDVVSVHWELPGNRRVEGERLSRVPVTPARFTIRAVARDADGNVGQADIMVTAPPAELADARGLVLVQAEEFSGQGKGEVRVVDRIGNSGRMITFWHAHTGHWLEWSLDVPAEGSYLLYARYATDSTAARRSLLMDGASPDNAYDDIRFERSGGFCTTRDDWRIRCLGPPVHLTAGRHVLRMTNLAEGLALDYLAIRPVFE